MTTYITTPIYYVNDKPHIGHAYTSIAADILARYKRLKGDRVFFTTGTDEHGLKIQRAAEAKGVDPQTFVNDVNKSYIAIKKPLNLSYDHFIRTTDYQHKEAVLALWKKLDENGYIYKDNYSGWYCVSDECYVDEKEIEEINGQHVWDGKKVEWFEQESYFFKLSAFQEILLKHFNENPDFIHPLGRRNEVLSIINQGLEDLSITRTVFDWGIKVKSDPKHVIYVWLDALTNYITNIGFPYNMDQELWNNSIHIIGKDIIKFHAVFWPAFLLAAGMNPPKRIFAHGWWTVQSNMGNVKISKSFGNAIDPIELVKQYGVDTVRYYLFKQMPFGNDGSFSNESLVETFNADLASGIGNLCQRTLTLCYKNYGAIPVATDIDPFAVDNTIAFAKMDEAMNNCQFQEGLKIINLYVSSVDKYLASNAPWALVKGTLADQNKAKQILYFAANAIYKIATLLAPYMPEKSMEIIEQLGATNYSTGNNLYGGVQITKPSPIFMRIE